jgi:hypothetical protein
MDADVPGFWAVVSDGTHAHGALCRSKIPLSCAPESWGLLGRRAGRAVPLLQKARDAHLSDHRERLQN